jgi:hypothetical protein
MQVIIVKRVLTKDIHKHTEKVIVKISKPVDKSNGTLRNTFDIKNPKKEPLIEINNPHIRRIVSDLRSSL